MNATTTAISGIHHITAVAASASENLSFYEAVLGLRLVKQTVNFDDPTTYHLYYGDANGSPGTILTFFPWEGLPSGRPGAGMATAIAFSVPRDSIDYWQDRLARRGIAVNTEIRFGEPVLRFADPHALPLELVGVEGPTGSVAWTDGPVPPEHAVSGFHSATMTVNRDAATRAVLEALGMAPVDRDGGRIRFGMADRAAAGHFLDLIVDPEARPGRPGGGTVHHIAFRAGDDREQAFWRESLSAAGLGVTGVRDRKYFRSIYFHEPGGVLFEIATDPPGFAVDEPPEHLGTTLKLPEQYEPMRDRIERQLPTLRPEPFQHLFVEPETREASAETIVTLHGTGGSEQDLIGLARRLDAAAPILSPRGKVMENGMARFFRRVAEGVFDEADVVRRAGELADFLEQAAERYGRSPEHLTAVGYSNGANIAAAVMLVRPATFARAVLMRPMLPLMDPTLPDLGGTDVLVLRGRHDRVISSDSTDALVAALERAGARVTEEWIEAGHEVTEADLEIAAGWMAGGGHRKQVSAG